MRKILAIQLFLLFVISCTDQGEVQEYALLNTSGFDLQVITFDRFGQHDTTMIHKEESEVLYRVGPPYDEGPFGVYDSLQMLFEDASLLTYIPLASLDACVDTVKSPFCFNIHYICVPDVCTFEIDSVEYLKAR